MERGLEGGGSLLRSGSIQPMGLSNHLHVFLQFQHYQKLPPTFFSKFRNAIEGISSKNRGSLTKRYSLSPGTYVAVTSAHSETVEFLLRIFLKMPDGNRYRNSGILNV